MAPETAQDHRCADIRSDLYSLGCTFYFLLTGQAPFPGGGWPEKLLRHQLDSAPSAVVLRPDVPGEIAAILQRLMAKDPSERPQTPFELAVQLDDWLATHGMSADPIPAVLTATADGTSTPTLTLRGSSPTPSPTPVPALESILARPFPKRRPSISWPLGIATAGLIGLITALLMRGAAERPGVPTQGAAATKSAQAAGSEEPPAFVIEGVADRQPTLAAAIAAAPNGGVITIHGNGLIPLKPLRLHGKALTLQAAQGFRPRLSLVHEPDGQPWQPLISTDQPLRIEGLELVCEPTANSENETAHLVYVERASLTLKNCVILAPRGQACIVCRDCREVNLDSCQITAAALALCVETGAGETGVRLHNTRVQIETPRGAALSLWASESGRAGTLRLHVEDCTMQTGRAFAFGVLPKQISVTARNNRIAFHEALVSYTYSATPEDWRRATRWEEAENKYEDGGTGWLQVNGASANVHDSRAWQGVWTAP
jgi:hypothetical protein